MTRNKKRSSKKKKLTAESGACSVPEDGDKGVEFKMVTIPGDNDNSPTTHACHARFMVQEQNYIAALQHYDKAISQNPDNVDLLRKERASLYAMIYRSVEKTSPPTDHDQVSPPIKIEKSYAKRMAQTLNQTNGTDGVGVSKNVEASDELIKEQELLIQAYASYYGWGTPKNYSEAFLHFQNATTGRTTKTEASYRLAKMMIRGEGTEQNTEEGLELLRKTALEPEGNPEDVFNNQRNVGVPKSCYELGRHFEQEAEKGELNSFEDSYLIAAMWYELGSHVQSASAISALGLLYTKGKGVPRNEKVAEINFNNACQYGGHTAYLHLADLFMDQMEFKKAKSIIQSGFDLNDDRITATLKENMNRYMNLDEKIQDIKITRKYVKQFEKSYGFVADGFTFRERLNRMDSINHCASVNKELHGQLFRSADMDDGREGKVLVSHKPIVCDYSSHEAMDLSYHLDDLLIKSICGSTYAKLLWDTQTKYCELMKFLDGKYGDWKKITHSYRPAKEFVLLLFSLLKLDYLRISWRECYVRLIYRLLSDISTVKFYDECPNFLRALAVCLAEIGAMHKSFQPSSLQYLVRAWTLYPREVKLSVTLANYYAGEQEFEKAYTVGKEVLERYPDSIDVLFNHAQICLQVTLKDDGVISSPLEMKKEAIRHLNRFLSVAPKDHPKVPETYYILGKIYHDLFKESENSNREFLEVAVRHFLLLGQCAEQNQLTCFIPYECQMKNTLNSILKGEDDALPSQEKPNDTQQSSTMSRSLEIITHLLKDVSLAGKKNPFEVESLIRQNIITDQTRINLINQQRNRFKLELSKSNHKCVEIPINSRYEDGRKRRLPGILSNLWPLTIDEALVPPVKTWEGRSMCLTVIDETLSGFGLDGVHAIVKDENGNIGKVVFLDIPQDDDIQKNFGFGCKFYILQPHVDTYHGEKVIVAGPHTAFFSAKDDSLCRYCFKPGAKTSCSRCRWANYCNKECQSKDWVIMKHKKICYSSPPWNKDLHRPM